MIYCKGTNISLINIQVMLREFSRNKPPHLIYTLDHVRNVGGYRSHLFQKSHIDEMGKLNFIRYVSTWDKFASQILDDKEFTEWPYADGTFVSGKDVNYEEVFVFLFNEHLPIIADYHDDNEVISQHEYTIFQIQDSDDLTALKLLF